LLAQLNFCYREVAKARVRLGLSWPQERGRRMWDRGDKREDRSTQEILVGSCAESR